MHEGVLWNVKINKCLWSLSLLFPSYDGPAQGFGDEKEKENYRDQNMGTIGSFIWFNFYVHSYNQLR